MPSMWNQTNLVAGAEGGHHQRKQPSRSYVHFEPASLNNRYSATGRPLFDTFHSHG